MPLSPAPGRRAGSLAGLLVVLACLLGTSGAAAASTATATDASIAFVQPEADDSVSILVSLPPQADPSLDSVGVTIGGTPVDAAAVPANSSTVVTRTAVLVMDTSNSMAGAKFEGMQAAARAFVDTVPDDVAVGIVTFAADVALRLAPTTDRQAALEVIDTLELSSQTALYDAVLSSVELAGIDGQRKLLVLSDGADTTETPLEDVTAAVAAAEVTVDVISLEQDGRPELQTLARAGLGEVRPATAEALSTAFTEEADLLDRQVLVTASLPDGLTAVDQNVTVTLDSGDGPLVAEAFATVAESVAGGTGLDDQLVVDRSFTLPGWAMYAGVAAVGLGLVTVLVLLVPQARPAASPADRIQTYTSAAFGRNPEPEEPTRRLDPDQALSQAREAATQVLQRSQGLEDRIAARLDGAGSELKPAEWLLVHAGTVVVAGLLGLLTGGGNLVVGLLFLALGVAGPWLYLGFRRSSRRKKFNDMLPDTLQLISGALSAGLSLNQAVDTVVREGGEPMSTEFKRVLVETRLGVDLEIALEGVAQRFDSKDFAWVVMAIRIQRQVGGNLAELLDTVGATMRERAYLRRQVSALAAEGKLSAYVLGGLPPVFLLYLSTTNREYVGVLFTDPRGIIMLIGAAVWLSVGAFWMSKLVKVEI